MKILTFDTSLNKTYLTYGENSEIIISKEISSTEEKYHSAYLVPEIINILKSQNIRIQDIDAIGINEGPGSFTGIRICTVIARVAAQQANIKVVPIPSLEILAGINKSTTNTTVFLDARKNKAYSAEYDLNGNEIIAPTLVEYDKLIDFIENKKTTIITDTTIQNLLKEKNIESANYESENYPLGKILYKITYKKLCTNNDYHWAKAKPLYIQPPSITLSKKVGK